jgi:MFS transporter, ACS family, glucarate transporter
MQAGERSLGPLSQRPTRVRWLIFALACAASWLLYLHRYSWGVLKPAFRREHPDLTDTEVGWLDAAFNAAYAIGQVPGGLAGDAFGPRAILTALILLWSLAAVGVAWVTGFWGLFGARATFGLAQAGAYPVLSKVTRTWFPLSVRTSVQGVVAALGRVGAACSSLILATLLMGLLGLSWQAALWVLAVPGVAVAVAFWIVARDGPRGHPWTNPAERELLGAGTALPAAGPRPALRLSRAALVSLGMLLLYSFASTFQDQLYVFWIPSFLVEGRGLDMEEMGLYTTLPLLGGAVGAVLGGVLNDALLRTTGRRWARSAVGFTGKFLAAVLVVVSVQVADGRLAMVVLFAARVFGDWGLASLWGAITDTAGRASGTIFGLVNACGAIGGFVAGPALGALKQHHGWEGLFLGVALLCLVSALCWLFIDCTRRLVAD